MKEPLIQSIKIKFEMKFETADKCKLVYDSLLLESSYDPNERSSAKLEQQDTFLILKIEAIDSVSARASMNSFLKWINLSLDLISYVEQD